MAKDKRKNCNTCANAEENGPGPKCENCYEYSEYELDTYKLALAIAEIELILEDESMFGQ